MSISQYILCLCFIFIPGTESTDHEIDFDYYECPADYGDIFVFHDDTYYVTWSGLKNPPCSITFDPSDPGDKLCIKAESFDIQNCSITIDYYGGILGDELRKAFKCFDEKPDTFCGVIDGNVAIQIQDNGNLPQNPGNFRLKIHVDNSMKYIIIGLCVGGMVIAIAFIVVITMVFIIRKRQQRRRANRELLLNPDTQYPPQMGPPDYSSISASAQFPTTKQPDNPHPPKVVNVSQPSAFPGF